MPGLALGLYPDREHRLLYLGVRRRGSAPLPRGTLQHLAPLLIVNLAKTWPAVLNGEADAADVTRRAWAQIKDADLQAHADVILGIHKNEVVTAFNIENWARDERNRVTFVVQDSQEWSHLIGTPNPGRPWVQGMARPVQVLPTTVLTQGNVPVEDTPTGRRAIVGGYVLTVEDGSATLQVPERGKVTVSLVRS